MDRSLPDSSMEFPKQDYWSGLPCPIAGDPPDAGIKRVSLPSPALAGSLPPAPPGKPTLQLTLVSIGQKTHHKKAF